MQDSLEGINEKMLWKSITGSPRLAVFLRGDPSQEPSEQRSQLDLNNGDISSEPKDASRSPSLSPDDSYEKSTLATPLEETTQLIHVPEETPPPTEISPVQPLDSTPATLQEPVPILGSVSTERYEEPSVAHTCPDGAIDIPPPGESPPPALPTPSDVQTEEPLPPTDILRENTTENHTEQIFPESALYQDDFIAPQSPNAQPDNTSGIEIHAGQAAASLQQDSGAKKHGFSNDTRTQSKTNLVLGVAALLAVLVLLISILITWPTISQLLGLSGRPTATSAPPKQPSAQQPTVQPNLEQATVVRPSPDATPTGTAPQESASTPSPPASSVAAGK